MHLTPFIAATILVFAIASPLHAQGIEVFGGYSVNADYVQNRPAILVVDQNVSPFFSAWKRPCRLRATGRALYVTAGPEGHRPPRRLY